MSLDKNSKIYVAGHHGLVGSAIWNNLLQRGYTNLVGRSHKELDLTDQVAEVLRRGTSGRCCPGCCLCRWHHGQLTLPRRLHHDEHEDSV